MRYNIDTIFLCKETDKSVLQRFYECYHIDVTLDVFIDRMNDLEEDDYLVINSRGYLTQLTLHQKSVHFF